MDLSNRSRVIEMELIVNLGVEEVRLVADKKGRTAVGDVHGHGKRRGAAVHDALGAAYHAPQVQSAPTSNRRGGG